VAGSRDHAVDEPARQEPQHDGHRGSEDHDPGSKPHSWLSALGIGDLAVHRFEEDPGPAVRSGARQGSDGPVGAEPMPGREVPYGVRRSGGPRMRRLVSTVALTTCLVMVALSGTAWAAWDTTGSGSGSAAGIDMPTGSTPTVNVTGRNVVVNWSQVALPDATPVTAYSVTRYNAADVAQTMGASCNGTIAALTCTEAAVPPGMWNYTIAPMRALWLGTEGSQSADVTVAPASLTLSSPTINTLPATLGGSVASFITGETLTFRLDDPSTGTILGSTVTTSPIPFAGSSAITVTIPLLTPAGAHTVYAIGSLGSQASAGITVNPNDTVAPTVSTAIIAKSAGGTAGYVRQAGQYYAYAQVTDSGSPASGVSTVRANLGNVTTGATSVALVAGSYTVQGVSYNFRTAVQTASNPLAAGSKSFSITAADVAGNSGTTSGFSVTVDNTAPAGSDIQTTNAGGGTTGRAETGDTITLTYSEPMDPYIILAGWNGTATTVTLRLVQNGGGDRVQIFNAANTTALPLGTVLLNRTDYTTATVSFSNSTMVMSGSAVTVTLGTPGGAVTTAAGTGTSTWTPANTATDYAGNACSTAVRTETGAADKEF
jgi:hypothetical protein